VFEMYADVDAYRSHLETPHFKNYKTTTHDMVPVPQASDTVPIVLGAKPR
jgi:quinol monooxygenase YgiN